MKLLLRLVAILILMGGCDTTIDPVREDSYSVYGYISPDADRQFVRVKPLDEPLRADANRFVDATVRLQNVDAGVTHTLRDSVIVFVDEGDSLSTHNFWTDADIQPETTYRLTVERNGEVITTAETQTPTSAPPTTVPSEGDCLTSFRVRFDGVERPPIHIRGEFQYDGQRHRVPIDAEVVEREGEEPYLEFTPETDLLAARIPGNDPITIPFRPDLLPPRCLDLDSDTLRVSYVYAGPNWHEFDVDATDPLSFIQYVENQQIGNGQGFFGALSRGQVAVTVDTSDTLQVGGSVREPIRREKWKLPVQDSNEPN